VYKTLHPTWRSATNISASNDLKENISGVLRSGISKLLFDLLSLVGFISLSVLSLFSWWFSVTSDLLIAWKSRLHCFEIFFGISLGAGGSFIGFWEWNSSSEFCEERAMYSFSIALRYQYITRERLIIFSCQFSHYCYEWRINLSVPGEWNAVS